MRRDFQAFNDFEQGPDFERARMQIATPFDYYDIALDVASSNQILNISGDFLYVDTAFDGVATVELNNEHIAPKAPFQVRAGFAINALFKQLKISWTAQPGKKIRLLFSTGERVIPSLSGTLNVTGTVNTLEQGYTYGGSYKTNANLAANTPDTIVAPGANVAGLNIISANISTYGAGNLRFSLIAKASPPANVIDGDILMSGVTINSGGNMTSGYPHSIFVPAGKGLYRISDIAETNVMAHVLYTLN